MKGKAKKGKAKKGKGKVTFTVAAGGVVPINLTLGNKFGKTDKIKISVECCGPYHQCDCGSMYVPA